MYIFIYYFIVIKFFDKGIENGKDGQTTQTFSKSEELQEIQNKTVSKQVLTHYIS